MLSTVGGAVSGGPPGGSPTDAHAARRATHAARALLALGGGDAAAVVPRTGGIALEHAPARERAGYERGGGAAHGEPHRQRAGEPHDGEGDECRDRQPDDPYGHEAPRHRLSLRLGVEVRDDPPCDERVSAYGQEIGILPRLAAKRDPAEPHAKGEQHETAEPGSQGQQRSPGRHRRKYQQREQHDGDPAQTGAEQWKGLQTGRVKREALGGDRVAEGPQVFGDDFPGAGGRGSACLAGHRDEAPQGTIEGRHRVSAQADVALDPRLAGAGADAPTSATAALAVSWVMRPASTRAPACCS